jgi:hypothetical protein
MPLSLEGTGGLNLKRGNKMKKILIAAAVLLLAAFCAVYVSAADSPVAYVTIADADGALAVAQEPVSLSDVDRDGQITINDALILAHDEFYDGGAVEGYASGKSEYGLSMTKLWGSENGGSYGYYVNGAAAWALDDPVADGDYVDAFVYTDLETWSDMYCFFEQRVLSGETVAVTLTGAGYDENWNPVSVPVEGAEITVDGVKTGVFTDENGQAVVTLEKKEGRTVISAVSDSMTLVPPAAVAGTSETAPQTADPSLIMAAAALISLGGFAYAARRKVNEK